MAINGDISLRVGLKFNIALKNLPAFSAYIGGTEYPAKYVTVYNGSAELPMLTAEVFSSVKHALPMYIDGESFAARANVGGVEPCSDTGGGSNIQGWGTNGWVRWDDIYFDPAQTELSIRVANNGTTGTLEVREGSSTGTLLGTFNVPNTGGWQIWTTVTASITGLTGFHDLCFLCTGGNLNLNWFRIQEPGDSSADCRDDISQPSGAVRVEGESWNQSTSSNVGIETCNDTGGGQNLSNALNGSYAVYDNVNLTSGLSEIRMRVANNAYTSSYVEIRTGSSTGTLIGTVWMPNTTGSQTWQTVSTRIAPQSGSTTIVVVFRAPGGPNINWIQFQEPAYR